MKKLIVLLALTALALSACTAQSGAPGLAATFTSPPPTLDPIQPTAAATPDNSQPTGEPTVQFAASAPAKCTVVSEPLIRQPDPTEAYLFPETTAEDWIDGAKDAKVTFTVYSDLQCPYCSELDPVLVQLVKTYPKDVAVVFRHFPLSIHDKALISAQAAEAAGKQGKFNEMRELLFNNQAIWSNMPVEQFKSYAAQEAKNLGLEIEQFRQDMDSEEIVAKVQTAQDEGVAKQIPGTPFLLINGRIYQGPRDYANLDAIVKLVKLGDMQFDTCPEMVIDPAKEYIATLHTSQGDIVIELFPAQAPMTVNNFIFLARSGWYDDIIFHRVIPDFVAQSGDPSGSGYGTPGYGFSNEVTPELRFNKPGVVGMANAGPDSNGSQFFITFSPQPKLDGQYTVFGQVIEGMDVAQKLMPRNPAQQGVLPPGDQILSIEIEEK